MIWINKKILFLGLVLLVSLVFSATVDEDKSEKTGITGISKNFTEQFSEDWNKIKTQMSSSDSCGATGPFMIDLYSPAILIAGLMVLVSTITYMFGQVFQSDKIIQIAKEEYYQTGISIAIALIIMTAIIASNSAFISLNLFGFEVTSMIDTALAVSYTVTDQIAKDLASMMIFNGFLTFFAASSISIGSFHSSIHISPGLALKPLTDVVTLMVQVLSVSLSEWIFHVFSLCLIKKWAITVFVPLGMILRAIPFTRDGGNGILALMLVLYILYPVTFIGMGAIYEAVHMNLDLQGIVIDLLSKFGVGAGIIAFMIAFMAKGFLVPIIAFGAVDTMFLFINEALFMFFIMSLILPFFSIMIALTAAKEIAKNFFGVEINLSAIIRVI